MQDNQIKSESRSSTPWNSFEDEKLDPLQKLMKRKYHEHFNVHHIRLSDTDEAEFLNQITVTKCPRCGSDKIIRYGKKNRLNRYYCNACRRTFVVTTITRKIKISS